MAKQYQSTYGVVNEPSDAQRQYQTTTAVVHTEAVAASAVPFVHTQLSQPVRPRPVPVAYR